MRIVISTVRIILFAGLLDVASIGSSDATILPPLEAETSADDRLWVLCIQSCGDENAPAIAAWIDAPPVSESLGRSQLWLALISAALASFSFSQYQFGC